MFFVKLTLKFWVTVPVTDKAIGSRHPEKSDSAASSTGPRSPPSHLSPPLPTHHLPLDEFEQVFAVLLRVTRDSQDRMADARRESLRGEN